jgi:hypothetical protein
MRRKWTAGALSLGLGSGCVVAKDGDWAWGPGVERVELQLGSGDVEVRPSDSEETRLALSFGGLSATPVGPERRGDTVRIDLVCDGPCGGDATLEVPDGIELDLVVHRGDLHVEDILAESVDMRLGAGDLQADWLDAPRVGMAVGAGEGDVELVEVGCLWAEVGAGEAQVRVPEGAYAVDATVGAGALQLGRGITRDPDAERCLHAAVDMGHLEIRAR